MIDPTAISAENLMVPKSKITAAAWGEDKQKNWGYLTYIAILGGYLKLQNNEFQNFDDLLNYMAESRRAIGLALNHASTYGVIRYEKASLYTRINNEPSNAYRDQITDVLEYLRELSSGNFTIMTDVIKIYNQEVKYNRSSVYQEGSEVTVLHTTGVGIKYDLEQARQSFNTLRDNKDLTPIEKRNLLNKILFYVADAAPLVSGSAAVAQMIYHSLEKHFFGVNTYFDMPKSNYGSERGVSFDIIAMLSPDFPSFEKYLMQNILNPNIKINEALPYFNDIIPLGKSQLTQNMTFVLNDLDSYYHQISGSSSIVNQFRSGEATRFKEHLKFMLEIINLIPEADSGDLLIMQGLFDEFKNKLAKDKVFYQYFYHSTPEHQSLLSPPQVLNALKDLTVTKEVALANLQQSMLPMHEFAKSMQIGNSDKGFYILSINCDFIHSMAEGFANGENKNEPIENIVGLVQMISVNKSEQDKLFKIADEYWQTLKSLKQLKDSSPPQEQIEKTLDEIVDKACKDQISPMNPSERKNATDKLLAIYQDLDKIERSMANSYPLWKVIFSDMPSLEQLFPLSQKAPSSRKKLQTPLFETTIKESVTAEKDKEMSQPEIVKQEDLPGKKPTSSN